jgi:DNA-binding CsgD family transcriptional regulator
MSVYTLRTHTQNILTKLGVHSKLEALVLAIRFGRVTTLDLSEGEEETEG